MLLRTDRPLLMDPSPADIFLAGESYLPHKEYLLKLQLTEMPKDSIEGEEETKAPF